MAGVANKRRWIDILLWIMLILVLVVTVVRVFVLVRVEINQTSMYPTLEDGQIVWCNKLASVERGDIVVFEYEDEMLIKRAVALAGDKVWAEYDNEYYVICVATADGEIVTQQYTWCGQSVELSDSSDAGFLSQYDSIDNSYTVPDNCMLPLGDNRAVSRDGRQFGVVELDAVVGVVIEILC